MKKSKIVITTSDHARLSDLIAFGNLCPHERAEGRVLERELERAELSPPHAAPPDLITMNSRAELLDLDTGERLKFTLVFPDEADLAEGKISVLAPVGSGMLGSRVGDSFECHAPFGMRRLKVIAVSFQPETALFARV